jgi:hypothetical protein
MRGAARLGSVLTCVAGFVACGSSTGGEFPIIAHAVVEGTVVGTQSQPLDSVLVAPVFPASLDRWGFARSSATTGADGKFSLPIEIRDGPSEATDFPTEVNLYIAGLAEPPKYPAPPGKDNTVDSVAVTVQLKPGDEAPPVFHATLQLPISE